MNETPVTDKANAVAAMEGTEATKAIVMAAIFEQAARIVAIKTNGSASQILALIAVMVDVGLITQPSVAMDKLLKLTEGEPKFVRPNLLRDKLVLSLAKDGLIDEKKATEWLGGLDAKTEDN